ncbi:MAG: hypothetical protein KDA59_17445 [Planctomycetales bacterium]|nr:hypothetical protein [Planctomycetales bacterium]
MRPRHPASLWLLLPLVLCTASGAGCPRYFTRTSAVEQPAVFMGPPTLPDVIAAVNATSRVQQLQAQDATLKVDGVPALQADLAMQRPRQFRLRAELTKLTGQELDLGSNDELFWMWVKRSPQPAIYYPRHEQYANSLARQLLPVEPHWLIDALGLVQLDPHGQHEGPYPRGGGQLEIRSRLPSARGELTRVLLVNERYAWIMEQHLYDDRGQLLASARASDHRFYADHGVALPHHVDVQLRDVQLGAGQPQTLAFSVDVRGYAINQLYGDTSQQFALPSIAGYQLVDLADPSLQIPGVTAPLARQQLPPTDPRQPRIGYRPEYRGYTRR